MVGGQLHYKRRGLPSKHSGLFQHNAGKNDGRHADKVGRGGHPGAAAEQRAGNHGDKGDLGPAGNKGGGHDGHAAVPLVFDGPGGHDTGYPTAGPDQHGDKAFAAQAEFAEHTVQDEGDAGHVAAGFQKGQQQKQHQHLGYKTQHRADAGHHAVKDQAAEPAGRSGFFQTAADQNGDPRDPHAVVGGVRLLKAVFLQILHRVHIGHRDRGLLIGIRGDRVVICGHCIDRQRLLVLHLHGGGMGSRPQCFHLSQRGVRIKILCFDVNSRKGLRRLQCRRIAVALLCVSSAANPKQMPAFAKQPVVGPVGRRGAHGHHRKVVYQEHDNGKDG